MCLLSRNVAPHNSHSTEYDEFKNILDPYEGRELLGEWAFHRQGPKMPSSQAPPHPHKLTPDSFLKWFSHPSSNKDTSVARKEGATVARTFWVLFIQISVCGKEEGSVGGEQDASHSGADLGGSRLGQSWNSPKVPVHSLVHSANIC